MKCEFCGSNIKIKKYLLLGTKYKFKCLECGKEMDLRNYPELKSHLFKLEHTAYIIYCFILLPLANGIRYLLDIGLGISVIISAVVIFIVESIVCSHVYHYIIKNILIDHKAEEYDE